MIPYPTWLSSGDNAWQMTAATLVGLMSIPALAVLYGGLVQKKWAMNTVLMVFVTFCLVLIVWVLWAYKMGFGTPLVHFGSVNVLGDPRTTLGANALEGQASIPLVDPAMPGYAVSKTGEILNTGFRLPNASVEYFQFVFAAITPILFIGSVLGRVSFKAWMVFVPLWITFAYAVNAFLLWGGGYWASKGALDFSGGYVIHLAAGVSGFVSAAVIGPRLKRDREKAVPNNLMFVAVGAGILWLGWNGFNGGDPYFAGADAGAAVHQHQPGDRRGHDGLDPHGHVPDSGEEADLPRRPQRHDLRPGRHHPGRRLRQRPRRDHHRRGLLRQSSGSPGCTCRSTSGRSTRWTTPSASSTPTASPASSAACSSASSRTRTCVEYAGVNGGSSISGAGWIWGHHPHQLLVQFLAALTIIIWDGAVTFLIWMFIKYVLRMKLRFSDAELEIGDVAVHGEEAYPQEDVLSTRLSVTAEAEASPSTEEPVSSKERP